MGALRDRVGSCNARAGHAGLSHLFEHLMFSGAEPGSKFLCKASAKFEETYEQGGKSFSRVYVVKMKLFFEESFVASQTEGIRFNKDREVILDTHGKVLQVSGDGETEVPMLAM